MSFVCCRSGENLNEADLKAHLAALLRVENVGVLLGAGASIGAGGKSMKDIWMDFIRTCPSSAANLANHGFINSDQKDADYLDTGIADVPNVEQLLDSLEIARIDWLRRKPQSRNLRQLAADIGALKRCVVKAAVLDQALWTTSNASSERLKHHKALLQKMVGARQPGQASPWIFTTNYDLAIEWSAESVGIQVNTGFLGIHNRLFSPQSFDLGFRHASASGEARFGCNDCYLVKLHGSLTWRKESGMDFRELSSHEMWESHAIVSARNGGRERNAFNYGNVSPLVTRLHRLVEDEMFKAVVDVDGGNPCQGNGHLDWKAESEHLIDEIFGSHDSTWQVQVVNLKQVPQDLMPLILGSLLELYAQVLFSRGQGGSPATLLVLEEAHHYLRSPSGSEEDRGSALAYERLAKEGRKFGLSLWLSTQRPSEVSSTVLSQCNNWVVFKLNSEQDQRVVANSCEWADARDVRRISGLPRQHAMLLGGSFAMPTVVKAPTADPTPESHDGAFDAWNDARNADADAGEDDDF